MRVLRLLLLACSALSLAASISAQSTATTPTTSDPQAIALLQKSLAALTGGATIADVTMVGTVTLTKNGALSGNGAQGQPATQTGTLTLVATDSGQSQIATVTPSGTETTVQDISSNTPVLAITGVDGVSHVTHSASALTPHPAWFYPPFLLASALSSSYIASYVGHGTWQGVSVEHIAIWRTNGSSSPADSPVFRRATEHDIYLDSSSLFPVAITYTAHPYDPNNPNKPIIPYRGNSPDRLTTLQYSDYREVQGQSVAFHIRSSVKIIPFDSTDDLVSDIQVSSANFNTGAAIAVPAATN